MEFRKITMDDEKLFERFEYICSDYIFSYLYMFSEIYKLQIADDDSSVIIKSGTCKPVFYMPLGDISHGISLVIDYCAKNKIKTVFAKIPYTHLGYFDASKFELKEDRNSFDYIFRNEDLAGYHGMEYRKQRNNLSNYLKTYTPLLTDIYGFVDKCKAFTLAKYSKIDIYNPTIRLLDSMNEFNCMGKVVWNGDSMQGFCVYQKVSADTVVSHVELTDNTHRGIHTYLINEMSKDIHEEYINKEDDMGLMGLKRFKESYNPWHMFKKYTAVPI